MNLKNTARITMMACASLLLTVPAVAQSTQENATINQYYQLLRTNFIQDNPYQTVAFVEQRWRIAGNTGFNESIWHVEKILQQAGYKKEVSGEAEAPLSYRIESRKMKQPTWEPIDGSLSLAGDTEPLLRFSSNRNMLAINSASTVAGGVTAEVVNVGRGRAQDFTDKDVKGKIVFAEGGIASLYMNAMKAGAIGVLSYAMPAYTQPEKHINSIQFQGIPFLNPDQPETQKWGLVLSYRAKEKLKARLAQGQTLATVNIKTSIYPAEELTLIANARGTSKPDERFVFSAHVQEPGANDNASGVGTLAEMARVTARLVQDKKFAPQRTITFLWGDEIRSTDRYIRENPKRAEGIKWGLSLDMVGEDTAKTGGSFLIEKMPDPSAIWTRGNDKHTEWGGSVLKESDMVPNYFTDFLINRCRQQGKDNGWVINANPYEGGSDHTPFLNAKIPGLLMWHFTDVFYHTDADRLDMVSKTSMQNVGISALAAAFTLSSADEQSSIYLVQELLDNATSRLETEFSLSKKAIAAGAKAKDEQHIIEVWADWYQKAFDKMQDIPVNGITSKLQTQIDAAKAKLQQENLRMQTQLSK
ncbi:M28 family peptidase [Undibacterium flavidum]|uniref:M28 family peptidase n=1 Tax=Undibacterium flavidum TaxID=2762297 RepID=A0ABR6YFX2_9BURK|nr:M28 family peptidase [Undibacterium flavidum]MBC3875480.1 M28 family peptidase [Undibacterium flavidum]